MATGDEKLNTGGEDKTAMIRRRGQLKGKITAFKKYIDSWIPTTGLRTLQLRLAKVEETWNLFDKIQDSLDGLEEDSIHIHEQEAFEDSYFEVCTRAYDIIEKQVEDQATSPGRVATTRDVTRDVTPRVVLPKIQLPEFSGKYEDWVPFRDIFTSLIHKNQVLSDVNKLHYLISCLRGSALEIVQSLQVTEENYKTAWDLLHSRYHNPRMIANRHLRLLFEQDKMSRESSSQIRHLLDSTQKQIKSLELLQFPVQQWDAVLVHLVTSRLHPDTLKAWEESLHTTEFPKYEELTVFLSQYCQMLDSVASSRARSDKKPQGQPRYRSTRQSNATGCFFTRKLQCSLCKEAHGLYYCPRFLKFDTQRRLNHVRQAGLCSNCLGYHASKSCKSRSCKKCGQRHNTLLHYTRNGSKRQETRQVTTQERSEQRQQQELSQDQGERTETQISVPTNTGSATRVLLSTARVLIQDRYGVWVPCRAMMDSASQSHILTESFCKKLKLPFKKTEVPVHGINQGTTTSFKRVSITMMSMEERSMSYELDCLVLPTITGELQEFKMDATQLQIPDSIYLADKRFNSADPIDFLIGAELFWELLESGRMYLDSGVALIQTTLGWLVTGRAQVEANTPQGSLCNLSLTQELQEQLQRFWEVEDFKQEKHLTPEEKLCETQFKNTVRRDETGRYIVHMSRKENASQLGESRGQALRRFYSLEKRLARNPSLRSQYVEFMQEYIALGHMEPVQEHRKTVQVFYLPHHAVMSEASTTHKVRVVFDGSARSTSGVSLNETLAVGPKIQEDLLHIVLRFRMFQVVIVGDIEKFYRQILIDQSQQDLQRIFWRSSPDEPLRTYNLKTVTYGLSTSPYLAVRTLQQLAEDEAEHFPLADECIRKGCYVDDIIFGADDKDCAIKLRQDITDMLQSGGFHVRKWCSNNQEVEESIPVEDRRMSQDMMDINKTISTLGILWDPVEDIFMYRINMKSRQVTKRTVLSDIARTFDPLGLLAPVIVTAKIMLQELWKLQVDWDQEVPLWFQEKWQEYRSSLSQLEELKIPRHIAGVKRTAEMQVHVFCDSSESSYGTCAYLVSVDDSGKRHSRLLMAKSRLAPIKTVSLPRLELCAAVMATQMAQEIQEALQSYAFKICYWTDSQIVLHWLARYPSTWTVFVANRVAKIQEKAPRECWRHVPSKENPADLLSRGVRVQALMSQERWWSGPKWLRMDSAFWPGMCQEKHSDQEMPEFKRKIQVTVARTDATGVLLKFSSLTRLTRVIAYCKRFCSNALSGKQGTKRQTGELTAEDIDAATVVVVKMVQQESFQEEIKQLQTSGVVSKSSNVRSLDPFIDGQGILRVGGRLRHAKISELQKHPAILPARHHITRLVIQQEHMRNLHAGCQNLLYTIREKYWILDGKRQVQSVLSKCKVCFRVRPRAASVKMGDLPPARVQPTRPFQSVGLDYAGPIKIKQGTRRNAVSTKGYILLCICFATKAIHLELVGNLTTEAFIGALRRFVARRGRCMEIYSDNAKTFIAASRELHEMEEIVNSEDHASRIHAWASEEGIKWKFIPPRAPHQGGLWEAAVKSMKFHFRRVVGLMEYNYEQLLTILLQIEACLNSRPLFPMSNDPNDFMALTPGHFLIGSSLKAIPDLSCKDIPSNRLSLYQGMQKALQDFWKCWSRDYLSTLQERSKWREAGHTITAGELVLIKEENIPPLQWRLARVVELHPGKDGVTRVVTLQTSRGRFTRALQYLCPLPRQVE